MKNEKKYNPFKMWGSWIGLAIFYLIHLINTSLDPFECCFRPCGIGFLVTSCSFVIKSNIFVLLVGFLIGWGIHSLIRRIRK